MGRIEDTKGSGKMKKWLRFIIVFLLSFILTGCDAVGSQVAVDKAIKSFHEISESAEGSGISEVFSNSNGEKSDQELEQKSGQIKESENTTEDGKKDFDFLENETTSEEAEDEREETDLAEDGVYSSKDDVARYLYLYGHLPSNFITKKEAEKLGWSGGSLESFAPNMCIGGSRFGNYEGLLPQKEGRVYTECDIDTLGAEKRGAKRIVFSNDGLIYYTEDHYKSFELLYGEE